MHCSTDREGGDVYNFTKQWMFQDFRHADEDQAASRRTRRSRWHSTPPVSTTVSSPAILRRRRLVREAPRAFGELHARPEHAQLDWPRTHYTAASSWRSSAATCTPGRTTPASILKSRRETTSTSVSTASAIPTSAPSLARSSSASELDPNSGQLIQMKAIRRFYSIAGAAAVLVAGACNDLDVTNPNNPDVARALASAEDVKNIAISTVNTWYLASTYIEPYWRCA